MSKDREYTELLKMQILTYKKENRFLEFKSNYQEVDNLGKYISALSNGACLDNEETAYLYFGVQDETLEIKGTSFDFAKLKAHGNQSLELYLRLMISPKIDFKIEEFSYENNHRIVVFAIPSAKEEPTCYKQIPYVRVESHVTDMRPYSEWMRQVYNSQNDWSREIVEDASVADLDEEALKEALNGFCQRYPNKEEDARSWDLPTFLDKAKLTLGGKITKAALLLVGKEESAAYLGGMRQINWRLRAAGEPPAGEPFGLPFILSTTRVKDKIRNYRIKIYPDNSLIPAEVWKYDTRTILEALHNAIAHQDYRLNSRIMVTEEPERLTIESSGTFFAGSYEDYVEGKKTPERYRNPFLVQAMLNLKMIDTQGYGIHTMYLRQKERFLPMPDYDKSNPNKVVLIIPGCIIDKNYSLALMNRTDISFAEAVLLDKVQKGQAISADAAKLLLKRKLIEGRKPNYYVGKFLAQMSNKEVEYTKLTGFDDKYYRDLILKALEQHGKLQRKDFNRLLLSKLPDVLTEKQKLSKVGNILTALRKKDKIEPIEKKFWKLKR